MMLADRESICEANVNITIDQLVVASVKELHSLVSVIHSHWASAGVIKDILT